MDIKSNTDDYSGHQRDFDCVGIYTLCPKLGVARIKISGNMDTSLKTNKL